MNLCVTCGEQIHFDGKIWIHSTSSPEHPAIPKELSPSQIVEEIMRRIGLIKEEMKVNFVYGIVLPTPHSRLEGTFSINQVVTFIPDAPPKLNVHCLKIIANMAFDLARQIELQNRPSSRSESEHKVKRGLN